MKVTRNFFILVNHFGVYDYKLWGKHDIFLWKIHHPSPLALVLPSLRLRFASALPSIRPRFAFASLSLCLCFAFALRLRFTFNLHQYHFSLFFFLELTNSLLAFISLNLNNIQHLTSDFITRWYYTTFDLLSLDLKARWYYVVKMCLHS